MPTSPRTARLGRARVNSRRGVSREWTQERSDRAWRVYTGLVILICVYTALFALACVVAVIAA